MSDPLILIADDNEPTRNMISSILGSVGYSTVQAIDGGAAAKVMREHKVDLALVDQYMEPMGGFEFAKHIQSYDLPKVPMILITAHETADLLSKAHELGFMQVLQKPVQPNRIVMAVERGLKTSKA